MAVNRSLHIPYLWQARVWKVYIDGISFSAPLHKGQTEEWAGNREFVMASFYLWNPGPKLQKSVEGLLRFLFYGCLKATPQLIPDVSPRTWR